MMTIVARAAAILDLADNDGCIRPLTVMSAFGQKQTLALQKGMSALLPKADVCSALGDVR
jgi:hypothetical protein